MVGIRIFKYIFEYSFQVHISSIRMYIPISSTNFECKFRVTTRKFIVTFKDNEFKSFCKILDILLQNCKFSTFTDNKPFPSKADLYQKLD